MRVFGLFLAMVAATKDIVGPGECAGQDRFNTIMCESHACGDCSMQYCTETCQKWQLKFPNCKCDSWPATRETYSQGEEAQGGFGDKGDYDQGKN